MKKLSALFLALCLLMSLMSGCGSPGSSTEVSAAAPSQQEAASFHWDNNREEPEPGGRYGTRDWK